MMEIDTTAASETQLATRGNIIVDTQQVMNDVPVSENQLSDAKQSELPYLCPIVDKNDDGVSDQPAIGDCSSSSENKPHTDEKTVIEIDEQIHEEMDAEQLQLYGWDYQLNSTMPLKCVATCSTVEFKDHCLKGCKW